MSGDTSSSSSIRAPIFKGNYEEWRQGTEAAFFKGGLDKIHLTPIKEFKRLEERMAEWEAEENDAAMTLALSDTPPVSSSPAVPVRSSSSSSVSSVTVDTAKSAENDAKKKVRSLINRSRKAYAIIYESLPSDLQSQAATLVQGYAFGLWEFLEKKFQNTEQDNIADLYKTWNSLRMKEDESYDSYKARVDRIVALLEKAKDKPSKGQYMYRLIYVLRPEFETMVLTLASGVLLKDLDNIDWPHIVMLINNFERSRKRLAEDDSVSSNSTTNSTVSTVAAATASGGKGQNWSNVVQGRQQFNSGSNSSQITCHHCGVKGHMKMMCTKWLQEQLLHVQQRSNNNSSQNAHSAINVPRCGKCGSSRHATVDHDETKVPMWRRNKPGNSSIAANSNTNRANIAQIQNDNSSYPNVNRYSPIDNNDVIDDENQVKPNIPDQPMATSATICAGLTVGSSQRKRVPFKPSMKKNVNYNVQSNKQLQVQHHLMKEKENTNLDHALKQHKWGIDTMASVHICGNKSKFIGPLRSCKPIPVKVADSNVVVVTQIGDVIIDVESFDKQNIIRLTLTDVLYHERFSVNLISWGKLKELNWELHSSIKESFMMTPGKCKINLQTIDGVIVLQSYNKIFAFGKVENNTNSCNVIGVNRTRAYALPTSQIPKWNTVDDLVLMHQRLGHVGFDTMIKMIKLDKTIGIGEINLKNEYIVAARNIVLQCAACVKAKGTKTPFGHRGLDKGTKPCEVMHLDTYEIKYYSTDGKNVIKQYGVAVTDAYSDLTTALVNATKEPIPQNIIEYLTMVQRQTNCKIKRIHCDGGTEFINHTLGDWCKKEGIQLHWTPANTPQLNGVSERHVRTHKEGARALLLHSGLPPRFWKFAVSHFLAVRNRTHVADTTGVTPYEAIYGRKPSVQHFGVFGCDAHYHINKKDRLPMQPKMHPGIYLGYDQNQGCSIIYRLKERDLIRTRDVKLHMKIFRFAEAVANGKVNDIINSSGNYINHHVQPQGGLDSIVEDDNEEEEDKQQDINEHKYDNNINESNNINQSGEEFDNNSNNSPSHVQLRSDTRREADLAEQKAIEDALAMKVLGNIISSVVTNSGVAYAAAAAAPTPTGMNNLEKQTPRTYKEATSNPRREE